MRELARQRLAGRMVQLDTPADRRILLSLESDCSGDHPELLTVGVSWGSQGDWIGIVHLVGELTYGAGAAMAPANEPIEFDIPARGTTITVPGSEGLRLYVRSEAGSTFSRPLSVVATLGFSSTSAPQPAQRTTRIPIPWAGGLLRVPSFARQLRILTDTQLGMVGNRIEFYSDSIGGTLIAVQDTSDEKGLSIPAGAEWYQMVGGGAAPPAAQIVSAIWELRL